MSSSGLPGPDASSRDAFGASLTRLRQAAELTVRDLAKRSGVPVSTVGDYMTAKHLPGVAELDRFRALLRACGVPDADVPQWVEALSGARTLPATRRGARGPSPYPGLASFGVGDAARFFGRDAETEAVLSRLRALADEPGPSGGLLAVIGPSGSGKSSLLRAGVAAAINDGRLDENDERWTCAVVTPGSDPSASLAAARTALSDAGRGVVVVDQFEEIFTAVADAEERAAFLRELDKLDTLVVLGMRADFYAPAAQEPVLLPALQHAQVLVGPLTAEHVREAIVAPAALLGATVDEALVDLLLADLAPHDAAGQAHDAGALPLLSHALLSTYERSDGARLTAAAYRATGGIDGAVQHTAEQLFKGFEPAGQNLARRIFLRLVHLDEVAVTRRRASRSELRQLSADADELVEAFVEARLVTASESTVEISHEALLTAWPRLHGWVDGDRGGLRLHRQITTAANEWSGSEHDPALLMRGTPLETALDWAGHDDHEAELTPDERAFLDAGRQQRDADRALTRRRQQRLRRLLAVAVVLTIVAAGLAVYAFRARSTADRAEGDAATSRDLALSRQIAGQAKQLQDSDPALAQQLALVAYDRAHSDLARSALVDQSTQPIITRVLGAQGPTALAVTGGASPLVAVSHADDGSVHLYRLTSGKPVPLATIPARDPAPHQVFALRISPNRRLLAMSGEARVVRLWDIADPRRPRFVSVLRTGATGDVQSVDFSPNSRLLALGAVGPASVLLWDVDDAESPRRVALPSQTTPKTIVSSVRFAPDGRTLAAGTQDGTLLTWRVGGAAPDRPRTVTLPDDTSVISLAWTPDSSTILTGSRGGYVSPYTAATLRPALRKPVSVSKGLVNSLDVSPDGRRVLIGTSDTEVSQWSLSTWSELSTLANPGPVTGVQYAADGRELASTAADGTLRIAAATPGMPVSGTVFNLAEAKRGTILAVASSGAALGVRLWDIRTPSAPVPISPFITMPAGAGRLSANAALTPDGEILAAGSDTGYLALWNVHDPAHPRLLGKPIAVLDNQSLVETTAYSPNGHLLAVGGDDTTTRLIDTSDPTRPRTVATLRTGGLVFNLAFSPNGAYLTGASSDKHGYVWSVGDPRHARPTARLGGFMSYAYSVAVSPDGRRIAVGSADHTTRLWALSRSGTAKPVGQPLIGPSGYVFGVAFSPDGRDLATASDDNAVRIYDVADARPQRTPALTLDASGQSMFAVMYSADGSELYGGGRGSSMSTWTTDVGRYASELCSRVGSPMTRDEWAIYVQGAPYDPPCR